MIKKFFLRRDYFGHHISLLFNDRGSEHNTVLGGLISILINLFMIGYIAILLKRAILFENDRIATMHQSQNFKELGAVNFTETNTALMMLMWDSQTGE